MKRLQNFLIYIASLIFIFPIFLTFLFIFATYRSCIGVLLKIKYGKKFGGFLIGNDRVYTITSDTAKNVVHILVMIEHEEKQFFDAFKKLVEERVFLKAKNLIKCTGIHQLEYGYTFILKNEYTVDECVRRLDDNVANERDLQAVLCKYANESLPKNHKTFWEILVCKKAIQWRDNEKKCMPIIIRCNHAMGDGLTLSSVISQILADSKEVFKEPRPNGFQRCCYGLIDGFKAIYYLSLTPLMTYNWKSPKNVVNPIHGPTLSGKKILVCKIFERPVIEQVKRIKGNVCNGRFGSVWLTAIAASFENYFEKHAKEVPKEFHILTPINAVTFVRNLNRSTLKNKIGAIAFSLPIQWKSAFLTDRLKEINRRYTDMLDSNFAKAKYYDFRVAMTVLPQNLLFKARKIWHTTISYSNFLSFPSFTIMNGHRVVDIVGWLANLGKMGVCFGLFTYSGNRLQLSLTVDAVLVDSKEKAEDILDKVGEYLNEMDSECYTTIKILD